MKQVHSSGQAGALEEIEITPAMIGAGVSCLENHLGAEGIDRCAYELKEIVAELLKAALCAANLDNCPTDT
jgi:hypothetical protein